MAAIMGQDLPCSVGARHAVPAEAVEFRNRIGLMLLPERKAAKLFWREAGCVSAEGSGQSPAAATTCEALTICPRRCETGLRQRSGEREPSESAQVRWS